MTEPVTVSVAPWPDGERDVRAVRGAVFGDEQRIGADVDFDGSDDGCLVALARDGEGVAIGTGRVAPDGHIGRMAVLVAWRGRGVGARLLDALVGEARATGLDSVHLNAQVTAVAFYEHHGFSAEGEAFEEAGIAHLRMERGLTR